MNNEELQKLKALAQGALNHSDAIGDDEWYSADENMGIFVLNPDLSFIAAANPAAILKLIGLAERALAPDLDWCPECHARESGQALAEKCIADRPAGEAGSIDTPEFHEMLGQYKQDKTMLTTEDIVSYFTTNLNYAVALETTRCQEIAGARQRGWDAQFDKEVAAAHAEGRRSALEELHPQWLKEKERADRAEAEVSALHERGMKANVKIAKLTQEVIVLEAARKAPDLSKLVRWERTYDGMTSGPKNDGRFVEFSDVQAILAQPLQQEGGKPYAWVNAGTDRQQTIYATLNVGAENPWVDGANAFPVYLAPQPPDKLQQASAAQAEPAKKPCPYCGWTTACDMKVSHPEAASATDAGKDDAERMRFEASCNPASSFAWRNPNGKYQVSSLQHAWEVWQKAVEPYRANSAQATPEGADLPRAIGVSIDAESPGEKGVLVSFERKLTDNELRTLHGRLAATTAAEPVLWVESELSARQLPLREIINGMCHTVIYHKKKPATNNPVWPLYGRASPPQKVDTSGLPG
jgi:hypothetical protein